MIPYDDLVNALASWRSRQGLPVAQLGESRSSPVAAPVAPPAAPPAAAAWTAPPAAAPRTAPPAAPPARTAPPAAPPGRPAAQIVDTGPAAAVAPLGTLEDSMDVDDAALLEETHYDGEGGDFAMSFAQPDRAPGESTNVGVPPPPRAADGLDLDSDDLPPPPPRRGGQSW